MPVLNEELDHPLLDAEGSCSVLRPGRALPGIRRGGVGLLAAHECRDHLRLKKGLRGNSVEIAIDEDEVRIVARDELSLVLLGKFGVGGALCVGVERLAAGDLVFRDSRFLCRLRSCA